MNQHQLVAGASCTHAPTVSLFRSPATILSDRFYKHDEKLVQPNLTLKNILGSGGGKVWRKNNKYLTPFAKGEHDGFAGVSSSNCLECIYHAIVL